MTVVLSCLSIVKEIEEILPLKDHAVAFALSAGSIHRQNTVQVLQSSSALNANSRKNAGAVASPSQPPASPLAPFWATE